MPFFTSISAYVSGRPYFLAAVLCGIALGLMALDAMLHRSPSVRRDLARVRSVRELHQLKIPSRCGPKAGGLIVASIPFLWTWCLVGAALALSGWYQHWVADAVLTVFVAGRFRSLQEIGHFGVHGSLCLERRHGLWVTEVFCQWPLWLASSARRWHTHIVEHHPNPNAEDKDPAIRDFVRIGLVPGISKAAFWRCLMYPLTPHGIGDRIVAAVRNQFRYEGSGWTLTLRQLVVAAVLTGAYAIGGVRALVVYGLALLLVYPLFAWWSVVVEHRWFVGEHRVNKREHELVNGRPTDYVGVAGWFFRATVFPFGDCYHLAHSLYPMVRWNYLRDLDALLKRVDPAYARNSSVGFLFRTTGRHSALSELRHRVCRRKLAEAA